MTKTNSQSSQLNALLSLLQDDNIRVASLAMEQFLNLGTDAEETLAEYQESNDPKLRRRIHQLSGILLRRRFRLEFLNSVKNENICVWNGIVQINQLFDPQCNTAAVEREMKMMSDTFKSAGSTTAHIATTMRENEFIVPDEDTLDVDLYLIERVLGTKYGCPALLCPLAHQIGKLAGWRSSIVLYEGRFCLMDGDNLLIDPTNGWHIARVGELERIHPCGRKDLWLGVLAQLMLVTLVEGNLRDIYHFGDLLTRLDDEDIDSLPFPLGEEDKPE